MGDLHVQLVRKGSIEIPMSNSTPRGCFFEKFGMRITIPVGGFSCLKLADGLFNRHTANHLFPTGYRHKKSRSSKPAKKTLKNSYLKTWLHAWDGKGNYCLRTPPRTIFIFPFVPEIYTTEWTPYCRHVKLVPMPPLRFWARNQRSAVTCLIFTN